MRGILHGVDLFSGTGVLGQAAKDALEGLGIELKTLAYCERDRKCQGLLFSRMWRGEIDHAPICPDVRGLGGGAFIHGADFLVGGWPCQGNSTAGLRKGMADERSGLVTEVVRVIGDLRPALIFLENVPGVLTAPGDGVGYVLNELARLGYDCRWTLLSASEVGASHKRNRFWFMAHATGGRTGRILGELRVEDGGQDRQVLWQLDSPGKKGELAHAHGLGRPYGQPGIQPAEAWLDAQRDIAADSGEDGRREMADTLDHGHVLSRDPGQGKDKRKQRAHAPGEGGPMAHASGRGRGSKGTPLQRGRGGRPPQPGEHVEELGDTRGPGRPAAGDELPSGKQPGEGHAEMGNAPGIGRERDRDPRSGRKGSADAGSGVGLADADRKGLPIGHGQRGHFEAEFAAAQRDGSIPLRPPAPNDREAWDWILKRFPQVEPAVRGVAAGIANRNDRIRALGNGVDYFCAKAAFEILLGKGLTE